VASGHAFELRDLLKWPIVSSLRRGADEDSPLDDGGSAARAAWRAEEEQWAQAAFEAWEHQRSLVDVARDCMHRGDTVAVMVSGRTFTGALVATHRDHLGLRTAGGRVDVPSGPTSSPVLRVVTTALTGGTRGEQGTSTFRARLLQLEASRARVEIGGIGIVCSGVLRVGRDQVSLEDREGGRVYVPIASLAWVRTVEVD
jgi:hypothetical protein